jgi:hypothetical protein
MKFRKVVHKIFWGISPQKWMSLDVLRSNTKSLGELFTSAVSPTPPTLTQAKDFDEAMKIAGIRSADIGNIIKRSSYYIKVFLFSSAISFLYACYLVHRVPFASIMVFMLTFLSLAYAWREHFNITKLRYRRLYLSIGQWWRYLMGE